MILAFIASLASLGEKEGTTDFLEDAQQIEKEIAKCQESRNAELARFQKVEKKYTLLAPPGVTTPCKSVAQAMQEGSWSYDMDYLCDSPEPMLNTLCSNNRTVGYGTVDENNRRSAWRPDKCALKIFTPAQACQILHKAKRLIVAGESLQRHTYQGLLQVLSGDYKYGSMQCGKKFVDCVGEKQYNEKICSTAKRTAKIPGCDAHTELIKYEEYWNIRR